ncbi:filamentous hemagglutinin family outer membrane protein [Kalymmatonema gypsitolerans NIES-4073]|nr:filamentous hemagglutinin family outer membrane protein [Scytonema sp. NIES-4073]
MSGMTVCWRRWDWKLALASWLAIGGAYASSFNCAFAQITPDGSLLNNSSVRTQDNIRIIEGGTQAGSNLFHSFQEFSVPTGSTAFFNNATDIQNIISRVTGKSVSNIDGLIRANGAANLFLINPNGIIFGKNASLNVGGSFVGSTASSLKFADGTEFSATAPQSAPLLTISVPIGLQFGSNPGSILNQSQVTNSNGKTVGLRVQQGKTLALVGGDVALEGGYLTAPDGRIELGSVAGNSFVSLTPNNTSYALGYKGIDNFQDIRLLQKAFVTSSGDSGGSIQVQGANVIVTDGSRTEANTQGAGSGEGLSVNASKSVQLIGESADGQSTSGLFIEDERTGTGKTGDLTINTPVLLVRDGARVETTTRGSSKGGNLNINASESVQLIGESIDGQGSSGLFGGSVNTATGKAGNLTINTSMLLVRDGAQVVTGTGGQGDAGNLSVNASESVQLIGESADGQVSSGLFAGTGGRGKSGDLAITTKQLFVRDGAQVQTSTFSSGDGGNLSVNASESVQLIGRGGISQFPSGLFAGSEGRGKSGSLTITTPVLLVRDGAQVQTTTRGSGDGGNLSVNASESVQLIGPSSGLFASSQRTGTGKAGSLTINTSMLLVRDGAQVDTSTFGSGDAGNLSVNASKSVLLIGRPNNGQRSSGLFASSQRTGTGKAGSLTINTSMLLVQDGAQVQSSTFGSGDGGNLSVNASESVQLIGLSSDGRVGSGLFAGTVGIGKSGDLAITTKQLLVQDGAQVQTTTRGSGDAGNLSVNASESVQLIGRSPNGQFGSGLITATTGKGNAGSLTMNTGELLIQNGAGVTANSDGEGVAGNLGITANSVRLDNGRIITQTRSGNGGNLKLDVADLLLMRRGSEISTTAGTTQAGGNGGNITINAPSGFMVARPRENNDITANAFSGSGGRVTINATGIFGMTVRTREDLVRLLGTNLDPQLLPTNDITAISQTSSTLNGTVTVNTPDVDPNSGLVNLPAVPVDTQVAQGCTAGSSQAQSSFIITGRGGLPPNPGEALSTDAVQVDLITLNSEVDKRSTTAVSTTPTSPTPNPIVEATGWVIDANGDIILTANAPTVTPHSSWQTPPQCSAPKPS